MKTNRKERLKTIKEKLLKFYYCEVKTFNRILGIK
jgi:hypothetical protein